MWVPLRAAGGKGFASALLLCTAVLALMWVPLRAAAAKASPLRSFCVLPYWL
jgi:hypothetical protein